ncbi:MAG: polysaccharide biosynthesis/export family protein [Puniceicoccaceae bacterium]
MKVLSYFRVQLLSAIIIAVAALSPVNAQEAGGNAGAAPTGPSSSYQVASLDYLKISLFVADELQFSTELRVGQNGSISVPHLGALEISGKSIEEVREALYEPYNRDYYVNPHIEITVLAYSERTVTVIGKVNRQGMVPFPSEKGLTLLEAIAAAGGWSNDRLADKRKVTITRTEANGEKTVIEVDARELTTKDYPLEEGDLINIPERIF